MRTYTHTQQQYVLAELAEYAETDPEDSASVKKTLEFLRAVNNLFEEGFLSHEAISSVSSPVLKRMEKGYSFFTGWLDTLLIKGLCMHIHDRLPEHTTPSGSRFSWCYLYQLLLCSSFRLIGLVPINPYQKSFLAWQVLMMHNSS